MASAAKAESELGWRPKYFGLDDMIASAWNWHRKHPLGFADREAKA